MRPMIGLTPTINDAYTQVLLNLDYQEAVRRSGVPMEQTEARTRGHITKALLYELGLSGGAGSRELRRRLCRRLALPERIGTNALPDVLSALLAPEELRKLTESLR